MKKALPSSACARSGSNAPNSASRSSASNNRPILGSLVGLLLCACAASPAGAQSPSYTRALAAGDSAYERLDPRTALRHYEAADAQVQPEAVFAILLRLSRVSYDIGLDLLAEPGSDSVAFYFERSVAAANRLVDVFPDSAVAHALMAATLGNLAQFQGGRERIALAREVERHSRRAIELDSTLAYPYVALGVLYREISTLNWVERTWARLIYGSIPEASIRDGLDGLKQAARLDPLMPFVHHELASTYLALGDTAQARVHWRRLLVLRPRTTQDLRNRDNARRNLGGRAVVVTAGRE